MHPIIQHLPKVRIISAVLVLMSVVLVSLTAPANVNNDNNEALALLTPTEQQRQISGLTRRFIGQYHYQPAAIDDALSDQMFTQFLDSLDPSKAYLLQSDIDYFSRYKTRLDDYLRRDDASPAFEMFNIYRQRVTERTAVAQQLLDSDFDFNVPEKLELDRSESPWAASVQQLNEYWRKRVKNDWLRLKLTDKEPDEIRKTLSGRYNDLHNRIAELDSQDVFQLYMNSYLAMVEPHTSYLSPRTSENFEITMSLSFEGIGALLGVEGEYTIIRDIIPGGPADLDKRLKPGDRIVAVAQGDAGESQDVVGWRIDDVVDLIRGPKGSEVILNVLPEDTGLQGPAVDIVLVRNEIQLEEQAAKSQILEIPDINTEGELTQLRIGVIDLPTFYLDFQAYSENRPDYRSSTRDVRKLVNELKREKIDGLVIDLRDNGGGSLVEATTLTGLFIDKGPVVQVKDNRDRITMNEDNEPGMVWNGPLAVLVNRYSASASEIFAAALQDYGRALIIGEPTYGKGTVQNLIDLDSNTGNDARTYGQLKMTMHQFFRINGGSTQNRGVIPDLLYPITDDPDEYGESALDNALPWTRIKPAIYRSSDQYQQILPTILAQYQQRTEADSEFGFLRDDIAEYQQNKDDKFISLLESERRVKMKAAEQRREQREALREKTVAEIHHIPLGNMAAQPEQAEPESLVDEADSDAEDESGHPAVDIYLDEASRIVADVSLLQGQGRVLADRSKVSLLLTAAASNKDQSSESETLISAVEIKPGTQLQPEG
ncbi:MAG: carboxy terminal-processing peptidase [Gammaproteobacteria bacterium]|jgi:carboxyl-terminal processing protease|nr:carboxy terminal-processing peptidase [Gammaproteobacteria bacterium]